MNETVGLSSVKGNSSVTDEDRNGVRAPGLVARLMGLESIPASGISKPNSILSFTKNPLHYNKIFEDQPNHIWHGEISNSVDFPTQKMPSSPIERFQTEILPPRPARTISLTPKKVLPTIKNAGFTKRNEAHIMEAVVRIINPAFEDDIRDKFPSSFEPFNVHQTKERISSSQRSSKVLDSPRSDVYLKEKTFGRSHNALEYSSSSFRPSSAVSDTKSLNKAGKGESVLLAIQAKVNVQRRKGVRTVGRNGLQVLKNIDEDKINQPFKSQPRSHQNKQQKKASMSGESGVLRQNNQKQNHLPAKGNLTSKQSVSNKQGRRIPYEDASLGKNKISMLTGDSRDCNWDDTLQTCTSESEDFISSNKDFPRTKRLKEGDLNCERTDKNPAVHQSKHAQPCALTNEQSKGNKDYENDGADILSNTCSLVKSMSCAPFSIQNEEYCEKRKLYDFDNNFPRNGFANKLSSHGLCLINGGALSLVLEQKLGELASGDHSFCNFIEDTTTAASSYPSSSSSSMFIHQCQVFDIGSTGINALGLEDKFMPRTSLDQQTWAFESSISSTNAHIFDLSYKLEGLERLNCGSSSSSSDARNEPDLLQTSPLSIVEVSFSSQNCDSAVACTENIEGSKMSAHSANVQNIITSLDTEPDLLDSAPSSSSFWETSSSQNLTKHDKPSLQDLGYLNEILNSWKASSNQSPLLNPLLFNKLESKKHKDGRTRRKMLFDRVNEFLDCRYSLLFMPNARAAAESLKPEDMAREVYREVSQWEEGTGGCMIDELVQRDMSGRAVRWVGFEDEAYEMVGEMEEEIVGFFINEIVAFCFHLKVSLVLAYE
ncbi:hypothetical protein HPP92_002015 [Vanilla planifolia]|uniref:DUF4378 domain-containing protein n=1 Tax=Vanilla planifolia TaxID=51239 RepID=A0A835RXB2_VANPL|nr:hypothetical protein HPP92_002015 [Vanilla planifolia]